MILKHLKMTTHSFWCKFWDNLVWSKCTCTSSGTVLWQVMPFYLVLNEPVTVWTQHFLCINRFCSWRLFTFLTVWLAPYSTEGDALMLVFSSLCADAVKGCHILHILSAVRQRYSLNVSRAALERLLSFLECSSDIISTGENRYTVF